MDKKGIETLIYTLTKIKTIIKNKYECNEQ